VLGGSGLAGNCAAAESAVHGGAAVTPHDFDWLRKLLKERSGLTLSAEKQYLLESRLLPVARRNGLANLGELVARLKGSVGSPLTTAVVEAMTTNETYFFRDKIPFDHLRDTVIPSLIASRATNKRIRIWCTAASSGQEPYSIAMVLKSMAAQLRGYRIDLLATDLSGEVLDRAKNGVFSQFEVQRGLPIQLLVRYFSKAGDNWQIAPEIRDMVQFRTLNLLNDFSPLGQFDLIFCRNVLIYFDQPSKIAVLDRLARQIPDDGFLILGAAETVVGLTDRFKPLADRRGLFAPNPQARYQTTRSALNA
jgi:chemotaxis protein methyltransferase CheR